MAKPGWLSIRNVPMEPDSKSYFALMTNFLVGKKICPSCDGLGFKIVKPCKKIRASASIRFQGLKQLEMLKDNPRIQIGDVVREILECAINDRTSCPRCNGMRFVSAKSK